MSKQLRVAAVPLIAGAVIALTTATGWAFSQQIIEPNGNYNFNLSDPDEKAKLNESTDKSEPNSLGFHFSVESGQMGPRGFHSFGGGSNFAPPDYYQPLGNGN
jgi:hypothetical protein